MVNFAFDSVLKLLIDYTLLDTHSSKAPAAAESPAAESPAAESAASSPAEASETAAAPPTC